MITTIGFIPKKNKSASTEKKKTGNTKKGAVAPAQPPDGKNGDESESNDQSDKDQGE